MVDDIENNEQICNNKKNNSGVREVSIDFNNLIEDSDENVFFYDSVNDQMFKLFFNPD